MSRIDKLTQQAVELGFYQQTKDQEAIARVRELHQPVIELCGTCEDIYPCATIQALDGEK